MARVRLDSVSKHFGDVAALVDVELDIDDGDFMILLGPSGCGKSTLLRLVAGLEVPTAGDVWIGDRRVNDVAARERNVAMVFQSYALYPHKTVAANIEFPLKARGVDRVARSARAREVAETLGLSDLLDRRPAALSGGQRQRVALARAMVRNPEVFLMDEPLSNLDAALRSDTRAELIALQRRLGTTFVYVTHDQVEAMTMGSRVAVMANGALEQVGTPREVYDTPASAFVARFVGSPPMNLLEPGRVEASDHVVGLRAEHLRVDVDGPLEVTITLVEHLGHEILATGITDDGHHVVVRLDGDAAVVAGERLRLGWDHHRVHRFDRHTGRRLPNDLPSGIA